MENSYKVFLKSDKCEHLKEEINVLPANLQGVSEENEEIKKLREFHPKYFDTIKFSDGQIQKKGGIGEFLKGNGSGFENYDEIRSCGPFYENRDMGAVSKWAKWRNDGIKQMNGESCPFCTYHMEPENSGLQQLAIETDYLLVKINKIVSFRPMNEGAALDLTVLSEGQVALSEFLGEIHMKL